MREMLSNDPLRPDLLLRRFPIQTDILLPAVVVSGPDQGWTSPLNLEFHEVK